MTQDNRVWFPVASDDDLAAAALAYASLRRARARLDRALRRATLGLAAVWAVPYARSGVSIAERRWRDVVMALDLSRIDTVLDDPDPDPHTDPDPHAPTDVHRGDDRSE